MASYKILSPHYEGPSSVSHRAVDAKDIKSGHVNPPDTIFAKDGVVRITANTRFETSYKDFLKNGPVTQIDDYRFGRWIKRGNDNYPNREWNKPIPKMPDFAVIQSPRLGMYFHSEHDTPVNLRASHDIVNAFDPNRVGFAYSKIADLEGKIKGLIDPTRNRFETEQLLELLDKDGIPLKREQLLYGLGIENGDFFAAYYPGQRFLVVPAGFHEKAKALISKYTLADKEAIAKMEDSILFHELVNHGFAEIGGDRASEKLQGLIAMKFYSTMAEMYKGTKLERIYRALAQEGRDYAEEYSKSSVWDEISADIRPKESGPLEKMIAKFETEAKVLGKKGNELRKYVEERISDTYGALIGGEPSYKPSKTNSKSNNKKSSNKQSLEEIASEADKLPIAVAEEGIVPTYEGRRVYGEGASMPEKFVGKNIMKAEHNEAPEKTYERKIGKSEYKSMSDAKRYAKEAPEAPQKAEISADTAEATASAE